MHVGGAGPLTVLFGEFSFQNIEQKKKVCCSLDMSFSSCLTTIEHIGILDFGPETIVTCAREAYAYVRDDQDQTSTHCIQPYLLSQQLLIYHIAKP